MVRICDECKKNIAEGSKVISFIHNNLEFTIIRWQFYCAGCARRECIERFDNFNNRYNLVFKEGDETKVNWELYVEAWETKILEKMSDILMDLGILSLKREGCWNVVTFSSIGLNPWFIKQFYLYFVRKEDAIEFARLKYSNTVYDWMLRQITKDGHYTLNKEEVLKNNVVIK